MRDKGYDFIRFLATMMIVVYHFYSTVRNENIIKIPSIIVQILGRNSLNFGAVGVALFFLLSGALMWHHYNQSFQISTFYKKRFTRICIPQWIGFATAFLVTYITNSNIIYAEAKSNYLGIAISFLGLNYSADVWAKIGISTVWVIGEWFTCVILVTYILFPLFRYLFKNYRLFGTIFIMLLFATNLKYEILSGHDGWFSFTNAFMYFWIGMLFEEYKNRITPPLIISDVIVLTIFYIANPKSFFDNTILPCFVFSILLFLALYHIQIESKFTKYIVRYNYEIYLIHHRVYLLVVPYWLTKNSNGLQIVLCGIVLIGLIFLLAEYLKKSSDIIYDLLYSGKS